MYYLYLVVDYLIKRTRDKTEAVPYDDKGEKEKGRRRKARSLGSANTTRRWGGSKNCYRSVNVQRDVTERKGRRVPVEEPCQGLIVSPIVPPVSN